MGLRQVQMYCGGEALWQVQMHCRGGRGIVAGTDALWVVCGTVRFIHDQEF